MTFRFVFRGDADQPLLTNRRDQMFNDLISNVTVAGAYTNAVKAANESDRRHEKQSTAKRVENSAPSVERTGIYKILAKLYSHMSRTTSQSASRANPS